MPSDSADLQQSFGIARTEGVRVRVVAKGIEEEKRPNQGLYERTRGDTTRWTQWHVEMLLQFPDGLIFAALLWIWKWQLDGTTGGVLI